MADKKKVVESLENQIRSLEDEIEKLKKIAAKVGADSTRILSEVEDLENEENILKMEFNQLKKSGDAWKELELGFQKQLDELHFNLTTAMNKLKEKVE